jgi:hypothetical protein
VGVTGPCSGSVALLCGRDHIVLGGHRPCERGIALNLASLGARLVLGGRGIGTLDRGGLGGVSARGRGGWGVGRGYPMGARPDRRATQHGRGAPMAVKEVRMKP